MLKNLRLLKHPVLTLPYSFICLSEKLQWISPDKKSHFSCYKFGIKISVKNLFVENIQREYQILALGYFRVTQAIYSQVNHIAYAVLFIPVRLPYAC